MATIKSKTNQPSVVTDTSLNDQTYTRQASLQSSSLLITMLVAVLAFSTGYLLSQVQNLKNGNSVLGATQQNAQANVTPAAAQPSTAPVALADVKNLFKTQKMKFGDENSKVLFVEFSDPSCPYCSIASGENSDLAKQAGLGYKADGGTYIAPVPEMKQLVDAGKAAYVQIYSPGHGNGQRGGQALYCATEQGKFWEAHQLLMSSAGYDLLNNEVKNDKANDEKLISFLADVLDTDKLRDCLSSDKYADQLAKDTQVAQKFGANGTPHFLVNQTEFKGAYSYDQMQSAVNKALGE